MHYIKRITQALDVPRALVLSNLEKISALEIEDVLRSYTGVVDCAVVGLSGLRGRIRGRVGVGAALRLLRRDAAGWCVRRCWQIGHDGVSWITGGFWLSRARRSTEHGLQSAG